MVAEFIQCIKIDLVNLREGLQNNVSSTKVSPITE